MGSSSLKAKPVRLIFTTFLTAVSLTMFGLTSTLMLFRDSYSISKAMQKSERASESVYKEYGYDEKSYRINNRTGAKELQYTYHNYERTMLSQEDIDALNANSAGLSFTGVYAFNNMSFGNINTSSLERNYYSHTEPQGFIIANEETFNKNGLSMVAGNLPDSKEKIVISQYMYEVIKPSYEGVSNLSDILNKDLKIRVSGNKNQKTYTFKISGIANVGEIPSKYAALKENDSSKSSREIEELSNKLSDYLDNSYHTAFYVNSDFYNECYYPIMGEDSAFGYNNNYVSRMNTRGLVIHEYPIGDQDYQYLDDYWNDFFSFDTVKENKNLFEFFDKDGKKTELKESLGQDEIYYPYERYQNIQRNGYNNYFSKGREMVENGRRYDSALYSLLDTEEKTNVYRALFDRLERYFDGEYDEEHDKEEDFNTAKNFIDNYYVTYKTRQHTLDVANFYVDRYQNERGWEEEKYSSSFKTFRDNYYDVNSTEPIKMDKYDSVVSYLTEDTDGYVKLYMIRMYLDKMNFNTSEDWEKIDNYRNILNNPEPISQSTLDEIINFIKTQFPNFSTNYSTDWINANVELATIAAYYASYNGNKGSLNVVGYYRNGSDNYGPCILNIDFLRSNAKFEDYSWSNERVTSYKPTGINRYAAAITRSNYSQNQIEVMLKDTTVYRYQFSNDVYSNLQMILSLIDTLKLVFLIVGLVFAVFSALMLLNFIATSIASKTKDIGILRAVGARGSDLFKIFFSESLFIAAVCALISIILTFVAEFFLDRYFVSEIGISILQFSVITVGLVVGVALFIAFIATIFPVIHSSRKPPVESIRAL